MLEAKPVFEGESFPSAFMFGLSGMSGMKTCYKGGVFTWDCKDKGAIF